MAKTAFSTSNALTKKAWEEKLHRDAVKTAFFSKFMGESSDNIIQVNNALTKDKGDNITFGLRMRLTGDGVTSGEVLEGNEEALTTYSMSVSLAQYRHAVRDAGALDRQRAMFSVTDEQLVALKDWGAEKIDKLIFQNFDPTLHAPTRIFYHQTTTYSTTTSHATAKSGIATVASGKLDPKLMMMAKSWALSGGNRAQPPLRPVMVDGKPHFVLLVHPDVAFDIKNDSTYNAAMTYAQARGKDNPIFDGSLAIYDGIVIHEHENVPIYTDGGSGDKEWAPCYLMGAQAGVWAWGQRGQLTEKDFDYGNEKGVAWGIIAGTAKTVYNSKDFGTVALYVNRTKIADA